MVSSLTLPEQIHARLVGAGANRSFLIRAALAAFTSSPDATALFVAGLPDLGATPLKYDAKGRAKTDSEGNFVKDTVPVRWHTKAEQKKWKGICKQLGGCSMSRLVTASLYWHFRAAEKVAA